MLRLKRHLKMPMLGTSLWKRWAPQESTHKLVELEVNFLEVRNKESPLLVHS